MTTEPTPEARDLVATALGRALDEVARTARPAVPTSMHRQEGGDDLRRYQAAKVELGIAEARAALQTPDEDDLLWVLVWDGYITIDEWRTDALYAHLEIADQTTAHLFAWRYGLMESGDIGPLGPVMYLGVDGRYRDPGRSHPLPAGEAPMAPHGQGVPRRRWLRRRPR